MLSLSTEVWYFPPPRLPGKTEFVYKNHYAVPLYYLSIQGIYTSKAKTESNLSNSINAGDHVPGFSQFVSQVLSKPQMALKHSTH